MARSDHGQIDIECPLRHVDIGSRLDRFVAYLASFREVEVFDIYPPDRQIPGILFLQTDMMQADQNPENHTDSLSCPHNIKHFGLGCSGDPLESYGLELGLQGLCSLLLKPQGTLDLSCPLLGNNVVHFNIHPALRPQALLATTAKYGVTVPSMWVFKPSHRGFISVDPYGLQAALELVNEEPSALVLLQQLQKSNAASL